MRKKITIFFISLVSIYLVFLFISGIGRLGKIKVLISVAPATSTLRVDSKKISGHSVYVSKGSHVFSAYYSDFKPASQTLDIQTSATISLLPDPATPDDILLLKNNPKLQQQREALAGTNFNNTGQALQQKYPFLNKLPFYVRGYEIVQAAPVRVKDKSTTTLALSVDASTPIDRLRAVQAIKSALGIDPSSVEIDFLGEVNIFSNGE